MMHATTSKVRKEVETCRTQRHAELAACLHGQPRTATAWPDKCGPGCGGRWPPDAHWPPPRAGPLMINGALDMAAGTHNAWMLATDSFSRTGADGSSPGDRIGAAGYSPS